MGPQVVEAVAQVRRRRSGRFGARSAHFRDWMRSKYGLRELILPEKYRVEEDHDVVVTYSSCLALLYFVDDTKRARAHRHRARPAARESVSRAARSSRRGPARNAQRTFRTSREYHADARSSSTDRLEVLEGRNPLERYESSEQVVRAVEHLVSQPNAGDITIFGAYDGYEIVSFDDQIGAHGAAGGNQLHPFLIGPAHLHLERARIDDARDIHRTLMTRYTTAALRRLPRASRRRCARNSRRARQSASSPAA